MWYWQMLAGIGAAIAYYVLRYDRKKELTFTEYLRIELSALVKGIAGFLVVWGGWSAFNAYEFVPFTLPQLPEMNIGVAVLIGFSGKKLGEYTVGKLAQIGKLPE